MRGCNSRISICLNGVAMIESFVIMKNVHKFLPSVGMELAITARFIRTSAWMGSGLKDTHKYAKYMNV